MTGWFQFRADCTSWSQGAGFIGTRYHHVTRADGRTQLLCGAPRVRASYLKCVVDCGAAGKWKYVGRFFSDCAVCYCGWNFPRGYCGVQAILTAMRIAPTSVVLPSERTHAEKNYILLKNNSQSRPCYNGEFCSLCYGKLWVLVSLEVDMKSVLSRL